MLMPKRVKRRRQFRGRMKGKANKGNIIAYGEYGLVALEPGWITSNQIEAARVAMTRYIRRGGKVWVDIFPHKPVTKKPAETRMGSGKGSPEYWVAVVKPGRVMFEIAGVDEAIAKEALRLAMHKLPVKQVLEMTDKELQNKLNELKSELFFLRFKHATNQLTNPMVLVETRRDIARVKTVIRQREIERAKKNEGSKG